MALWDRIPLGDVSVSSPRGILQIYACKGKPKSSRKVWGRLARLASCWSPDTLRGFLIENNTQLAEGGGSPVDAVPYRSGAHPSVRGVAQLRRFERRSVVRFERRPVVRPTATNTAAGRAARRSVACDGQSFSSSERVSPGSPSNAATSEIESSTASATAAGPPNRPISAGGKNFRRRSGVPEGMPAKWTVMIP